jgi:hypothetical protein
MYLENIKLYFPQSIEMITFTTSCVIWAYKWNKMQVKLSWERGSRDEISPTLFWATRCRHTLKATLLWVSEHLSHRTDFPMKYVVIRLTISIWSMLCTVWGAYVRLSNISVGFWLQQYCS